MTKVPNGHRLTNIENALYSREFKIYHKTFGDSIVVSAHKGLIDRVISLEQQVEKLKAVVAELVDYVYRENK